MDMSQALFKLKASRSEGTYVISQEMNRVPILNGI